MTNHNQQAWIVGFLGVLLAVPGVANAQSAHRLTLGTGVAVVGFGDASGIPTDFYDRARMLEDSDEVPRTDHAMSAFSMDLGYDYLAQSGHGAFGRVWGFTEVAKVEFSILRSDEPASYLYRGGGLSLGYRHQFLLPQRTGTHFVPSLLGGPALGWVGFDATEGTEGCGWFNSGCSDAGSIEAGPARSHFGVGFTAGGALEVQSGRRTYGLAGEYTRLWTVDGSENAYVAHDSMLRIMLRVGVLI